MFNLNLNKKKSYMDFKHDMFNLNLNKKKVIHGL